MRTIESLEDLRREAALRLDARHEQINDVAIAKEIAALTGAGNTKERK